MRKVIVGMSGGVDSSVAAWLLQQQGYQVEGVFMKNWEHDDTEQYCAAAQDFADAQAVCAKLHIPLHHVNFSKQYWDKVFRYFLLEYEEGRTPNPDILCNKEIKFKVFLEYALASGAQYIATGHYATVKPENCALFTAQDQDKDQTYFLHAIEAQALAKTLFPLGDYKKDEIRAIAKQLGLEIHNKKDSTGICFIGEKRLKNFLGEFILAKPGEIRSSEGTLLGRHQGLMFYTLGQRQGLGIGGQKNVDNAAWYVVEKDLATNTLIVALGKHNPLLYASGLQCGPIHWLGLQKYDLPLTCTAKIRYRQMPETCSIAKLNNKHHYIAFTKPQRAITPGQYVVFYEGNKCLGGAKIESIIR